MPYRSHATSEDHMSGETSLALVFVGCGLYLIGLARLGFVAGVLFLLLTIALLAYVLPLGLMLVALVAMYGLAGAFDPAKVSRIWRS